MIEILIAIIVLVLIVLLLRYLGVDRNIISIVIIAAVLIFLIRHLL